VLLNTAKTELYRAKTELYRAKTEHIRNNMFRDIWRFVVVWKNGKNTPFLLEEEENLIKF
jgi:hypothetical protein